MLLLAVVVVVVQTLQAPPNSMELLAVALVATFNRQKMSLRLPHTRSRSAAAVQAARAKAETGKTEAILRRFPLPRLVVAAAAMTQAQAEAMARPAALVAAALLQEVLAVLVHQGRATPEAAPRVVPETKVVAVVAVQASTGQTAALVLPEQAAAVPTGNRLARSTQVAAVVVFIQAVQVALVAAAVAVLEQITQVLQILERQIRAVAVVEPPAVM